jgi:Ca-activated chloride channel homolog
MPKIFVEKQARGLWPKGNKLSILIKTKLFSNQLHQVFVRPYHEGIPLYQIRTNPEKNTFENLLNIFLQLVTMTGGDVAEALSWLTNLDKRYNMTNPGYGIGDFIEDLKTKGYLTEENQKGEFKITGPKLSKRSGKMPWRKSSENSSEAKAVSTAPPTQVREKRKELTADLTFGDNLDQIALTDSIRNAQVNHGFGGITS